MSSGRADWLIAIRRYLIAMAVGNLVWETVQLPLYTLWETGTPIAIAAIVLHCLAGDLAIAIIVLIVALVLLGAPAWPDQNFWPVMAAVVIGGTGYTIYSEYVNTVRASWTYSALMPTLPVLGTGVAPLTQWLIVPAVSLAWAVRGAQKPSPRRA